MDNAQPIQAYERSIGLVEADIEANCSKHGIRGILDHNDILKIISEYNEEDKQARIFGKFQHLTGLVFKNFRRQVHVIKPFDIPKKDFVTVEALDNHPRNPDAVLWTAIDRRERHIVVDEIYNNFNSSAELAREIKAKAENYRIEKRLIDPSSDIVDQHTGRSLKSDLYNMGLDYSLGSKQRHLAIQTIKDALFYKVAGGQWVKTPDLFIFENCTRLIWEIEHWQYQEWRGKSAQWRSANEKPVDKDDHLIEDLGRILLSDTKFTELVDDLDTNQYGARGYQDEQSTPKNPDDPYQ